jgi:RHS repeat-associated protein
VVQPAYDKVGNQTADIAPGDWDKRFDLKWDAWNRLVEVRRHSTMAVVQANAYDGLTRRTTSYDGTATIHYYYNTAWRAVEQYVDAGASPERRHLWGLRSRWELVKRERDDTGSLDEKRYVLYDAMDPAAICDEYGNITQRFEYSPFGRVSFMDADFTPDSTPEPWDFLFHGEFRDAATGYYNYGYRFYNDTTGRWASRDPIEESGGVNLYAFNGNDGVDRLDYLGMKQTKGESNCLGFAIMGKAGACTWPEDGETMENHLKLVPKLRCHPLKGNDSDKCKCGKKEATILIYFYVPKAYVGNPWTAPQKWDTGTTPDGDKIDIHSMRSGCGKGWENVMGHFKIGQKVPITPGKPKEWDKRKVLTICCCYPCPEELAAAEICTPNSDTDVSESMIA